MKRVPCLFTNARRSTKEEYCLMAFESPFGIPFSYQVFEQKFAGRQSSLDRAGSPSFLPSRLWLTVFTGQNHVLFFRTVQIIHCHCSRRLDPLSALDK
jgi:hypothetical protein